MGDDMKGKETKHVSYFQSHKLKAGENIRCFLDGYIGEMMGKGKDTQRNGALIVTDQRVAFYRKGLLGEVLETIPIEKVTSVETSSLMGHRVIKVHTAHDDLKFKTFEDKEFFEKAYNAIEEGRAQSASAAKPVQPSSAPAGNDVADRLTKLEQLRAKGFITEDEFKEKRADILATL